MPPTAASHGTSPRAAAAATLAVLLLAAGCGGGDEDAGAPGAAGTANAPTATAAGETFTNPVHEDNFPDPFVLEVDGTYHAYATNGAGKNVPTLTSRDLVEWEEGPDALPELGSWAFTGRTWAPEVLALEDGTYVLYYTAQDAESQKQCIGGAVADAPEGPFTDERERALVCQVDEGGSIDASPFRDEDGTLYLLWKNDGNCCGLDTYVYAQPLSPDGLEPTGEPARLVTQDSAWEGNLVEAPTLWREQGRYYLFFSANAFDTDSYAVGYATCESPLGPCEDAPENPILATGCEAAGPGHQTVVRDDDGETWLVYHAWSPDAIGSVYPGRTLWIDPLEWEDGKPVVRGPTCGAQPVP